MSRSSPAILLASVLSSTTGLVESAPQQYTVAIEYDQRVEMRDGMSLSADVFRPDAPGRFPVVLVRTPYDNASPAYARQGLFFASRGFAYVVQDVRGRGESEGEFYPLVHEAADGYDTQTWCGTRSWSNGKVGTTGSSYMGWTQVYPAGMRNPYLAAMISIVTPPDSYRYDPSDPVPFITEPNYSQIGGPDDYRAIERRDDVLVYSTAPLDEPLQVCGPLEVTLYAASTARDTDWTAKILDVHPDGLAQRLNDGIVRARFRDSMEKESFLEPGQVESYRIDAWSTCALLGAGHRLRLEISSSAFPKFDRNLNTGGPIGKESEGIVAVQTVYHDASRPSRVSIPVVPR